MGKIKPPNMAVPFVNGELCDYEVIFDSIKALGWALRKGPRDSSGVKSQRADAETYEIPGHSTLIWVDQANMITPIFSRIMPWQLVNHFPGMSTLLARKGRLCRNLSRLQKACPKEFTFMPQTFVLPEDVEELKKAMAANKKRTYIYKPDHACQGRGISLMQEWEHVEQSGALRNRESVVVQRYLQNPLLLDGFKFDLRVYLLVTSLDPPQIFIFSDGLVRLSTQSYEAPNAENLQKRCMHLTNYAVNKKSKQYEISEEDGTGSKRHLTWFMDFIEKEHGSKTRNVLWKRMKLLCVKMILSVQPQLIQEYEAALPRDLARTKRPRCFELLGVDVMIDDKLKPWLLEVNHLPSFATESALDTDIKSRLITQILGIIPVLPRGGRALHEKLVKDDSEENRQAFDAAWQKEPELVDFERAYPTDSEEVQERYNEVLKHAEDLCQNTYCRLFARPVSKRGNRTKDSTDTTASTVSTASTADSCGATPVPKKRSSTKGTKSPCRQKSPNKENKSARAFVPRCALAKPVPREQVVEKLKKAEARRNSVCSATRELLPMRRVALGFSQRHSVATESPSDNCEANGFIDFSQYLT